MTAHESDLLRRSLNAVKWNYIGVFARVASQFVVQICLARLLGPEPFGIFAVAFLVVSLGGITVEMGLGSALIQKPHVVQEDVNIVYSRILFASLIFAALLIFLSGPIGSIVNEARISVVLRWMAPAVILQALSVVPLSLLRRNLKFRAIQIAQLSGYLIGYVVAGVGSAFLGAGVWSLVIAITTTYLVTFFVSYGYTRPNPTLTFSLTCNSLSGFGAKVALTNISNWITDNIDNLVVAKVFGTATLGLYSVSYNFVRSPTNHLVVALQTILFPASARAPEDISLLRRGYLITLSAISLISIPVFSGIACISDTIISALFGQPWLKASALLTPLALAMMFHSAMAIAGPMLLGIGRPGLELKIQFWVAVALVTTVLLTSRISVQALAWGVFSVYILRAAGISLSLLRCLRMPLASFWPALRGGLLLSLPITAMLVIEDTLLRAASCGPAYRLGIEVSSAAITWLTLVVIFPRLLLSQELLWAIHRIAENIPLSARLPLLQRIHGTDRNIAR